MSGETVVEWFWKFACKCTFKDPISHLCCIFVISYHYMNKTEFWLVSCIIFTKFSAGIKQNDLIIHNNQENWRKLASLRIIDYPTQHLSNKTIWSLMCWCVSNDNFALLVILADLPTQCYPHSHHLNKTQPIRSTHFEQEQSSLQSMSSLVYNKIAFQPNDKEIFQINVCSINEWRNAVIHNWPILAEYDWC